MWNFLAKEANWTEVVANTLALGLQPDDYSGDHIRRDVQS